jgi:hypothetical protein
MEVVGWRCGVGGDKPIFRCRECGVEFLRRGGRLSGTFEEISGEERGG